SAMALAPSRARCSCFLKLDSARSRVSFELFAKVASFDRWMKSFQPAGGRSKAIVGKRESASGHCRAHALPGLCSSMTISPAHAASMRSEAVAHPWHDSTRKVHSLSYWATLCFDLCCNPAVRRLQLCTPARPIARHPAARRGPLFDDSVNSHGRQAAKGTGGGSPSPQGRQDRAEG